MKQLTADELREMYLSFFESKGHVRISGASVIPENDPTVLFTTAGMHPLVPYLMGQMPHPAGTRLTAVQKCVRTGDIDEVGDAAHLTFFEMLGNWSLNDYFKKEAISWSFEFLTQKLGFKPEQLNVTVAELLQGRRVEEEQRFTREETEELIRKALTFSAEPPERRQARTKKYLPVYVICCVLGVAEALAVWAAGLADIEGALALLIIGVVFGVVYGAYAMFWMAETLPRYYDENRICNFAQGAFHIHIPGIYYNNRNWKHVLRAFRVWSMASLVLTPPCTAGAVFVERATGWQGWGVVLVVYIASLFGAIVIPAKRFE